MKLHQRVGAQILAFGQRVHDFEMLVDRSLDPFHAVDPLDVEERAKTVLALYRVEQIAIARETGEAFVEIGVDRIELDRHRVAPEQLAISPMLVAAANEPDPVEIEARLESATGRDNDARQSGVKGKQGVGRVD